MLHASLLIPLLLAAITAEKKGEDTLLRMACHLCDGSLVIGDVDPATKLKLATGTGKLNIPLLRIVRIAVADDRETMQIFLPNGNPVTGFMVSSIRRRLRANSYSTFSLLSPNLSCDSSKNERMQAWLLPEHVDAKEAGHR